MYSFSPHHTVSAKIQYKTAHQVISACVSNLYIQCICIAQKFPHMDPTNNFNDKNENPSSAPCRVDSRREVSSSPAIPNEIPRYLSRADAFTSVFQGVGTPRTSNNASADLNVAKPAHFQTKRVSDTMKVLVHPSQSGNPMLQHMQNVLPEISADITADYMMGENCVACFLSVRYHMLHPQYLKTKLSRVSRVRVQVVLCYVDVPDSESALKDINREALNGGFTLILAWSWKGTKICF
jgi:DNA repair protein Rad10